MSDDPELVADGGSPRTRKQIYHRLAERLKQDPGVEYTRFDPGRIAPTRVIASVDPTQLIGVDYPARAATLEVWWSPRTNANDHCTIQWYERPAENTALPMTSDPTLPDGYTLSCGWHQDEHHNDLGDAHFQEEYPDGTTERYGVTFGDVTPVWILSVCLDELPDRLAEFRRRLNR